MAGAATGTGAAYSLTRSRRSRRATRRPARRIDSTPGGRRQPAGAARRRCTSRACRSSATRLPGRAAEAGPATASHLVFTSTFDGELDPFLDALRAARRRRGRLVGALRRLPRDRATPRRSSAFRDTRSTASLFASAYRRRTVAGVHAALALRERIVDFAAAAHGLGAAELQQRFREAFGARMARRPPAPGGAPPRSTSRHPGQRPARLHVPVRGVPVPAHRRRRQGAGADGADAAARWPPPSRGRTGRGDRAARRVHLRRPGRRWACPSRCSTSFPEEFREGMAARADRLGDRGPSAPAHWEAGLGTGEAHVLVTRLRGRPGAARGRARER